jgi:hypothetical protein
MRNSLKLIVGLGFALVSAIAQAQSPVAMVLDVSGDVTLAVQGKQVTVEPFSRLLDGDRVKLGRDAKLSIVYPRSGRQENWSGVGAVLTGDSESKAATGNPSVEVKQLPTYVAKQMARTPVSDTSGKAGMVRMRAISSPENLGKLEQQVAQMRAETTPDSRSPDIYLLAGLNEMGMTDRIKEELARLQKSYPADHAVKALTKAYARSLNGDSAN